MLPLPAFPAPNAPLQLLNRVHNADVGGVRVRLYAPPSGEAEMPWVSVTDLFTLASPADADNRRFTARINSTVQFGRDGKIKVAIVPFWLASEMLKSASMAGHSDRRTRNELHAEIEVALKTAALSVPFEQRADYCALARVNLRRQIEGD